MNYLIISQIMSLFFSEDSFILFLVIFMSLGLGLIYLVNLVFNWISGK
ncbi:MAG: hypothetical protein SNJ77_06700 [Cytophagales bacterium]